MLSHVLTNIESQSHPGGGKRLGSTYAIFKATIYWSFLTISVFILKSADWSAQTNLTMDSLFQWQNSQISLEMGFFAMIEQFVTQLR